MIRISKEEDCPTNDYQLGKASGTCWGDGHYACDNCVFFRADFKKNIELRDRLLSGQGGIKFSTLQPDGTEQRWN